MKKRNYNHWLKKKKIFPNVDVNGPNIGTKKSIDELF